MPIPGATYAPILRSPVASPPRPRCLLPRPTDEVWEDIPDAVTHQSILLAGLQQVAHDSEAADIAAATAASLPSVGTAIAASNGPNAPEQVSIGKEVPSHPSPSLQPALAHPTA